MIHAFEPQRHLPYQALGLEDQTHQFDLRVRTDRQGKPPKIGIKKSRSRCLDT